MRLPLSAMVFPGLIACALSPAAADEARLPYAHTLYAIVKQIGPTQLVVLRSNGRLSSVDISIARRLNRTGVPFVNRGVALHGDYDGLHVFHAVSITGAVGINYVPAAWPKDE